MGTGVARAEPGTSRVLAGCHPALARRPATRDRCGLGAAIRSILAREGHVAHIWQRPDVRCQNNGGSCTADDASGEWTNTFRRASESSAHSACRNDAR